MTPTLVLTRPAPQARQIADVLGKDVRIVIAPVMAIVSTGITVDLARYRGVILTSANAVTFAPDLAGFRVYCVGKRTAEAARARGADVALVAQDADDLVARLHGEGPLVHLRGTHSRGDVAKRLSSAGIETHEVEIYDQKPQPLSPEARALIEGETPVVLPLYSPRSARLLGAALRSVGPNVHAIVLSAAVAEAWLAETGQKAEVCGAPTGEDMLRRISAALQG